MELSAARVPLPREFADEPLIIQFIHGGLGDGGHSFLAHVAMGLLTDTWFYNRKPWEETPALSAKEQFCLVHGVYHAWQSDMENWAMGMCLNIDKLYWWLCAARREDGGLQLVVEDLTSQDRLPGIQLMAGLVRLSTRAIQMDPRQWAGQVLGRLEGKDLTRHAFMSGARRLLSRKPQELKALIPKDEVSGLEPAGGAVVDVFHIPASTNVAYSPNGLRLASGFYGNTVRIWDANSGKVLQVLEGHTSWIYSVAYSPDGICLASASGDTTARIWNTQTGQVLQVLEGHTHRVYSAAFSRDGLKVASGSGDETMRIWDAISGQMQSVGKGHTSIVWSVAFSPNGLRVASGSWDKTVRIWDTQTGNVLQILRAHLDFVYSVAYSPDGHHLASASGDKTVCIWDTQTGLIEKVLVGHTHEVRSVAYSPDGLHLASGSDDGTVRIWDAQTGQVLHVLSGHTSEVKSVAYSRDGHHLASASNDTTVRIWDTSALGAVRRKKMKAITDGNISSKYHISESMSITSRDANIVSFTFDNHVHDVREDASLDVAFSNSQSVSLKIV